MINIGRISPSASREEIIETINNILMQLEMDINRELDLKKDED